MTYPQQQGGYGPLPGYPQPGGYGPHPPKKPRTSLVVGIAVTVVVAVLGLVLVLTGDDDDKPSGTAGGGGIPDPTLDYTATDSAPSGSGPDSGGSGGPTGSADPWELVQTMARIFETHDVDALQDYACGARDLTFFEKDLEQLEGTQVKAQTDRLHRSPGTADQLCRLAENC